MSYEELVAKIAERPKMEPESKYWNMLLDHSDIILLESFNRTRKQLSEDLNIKNPNVLSHTIKILVAFSKRD